MARCDLVPDKLHGAAISAAVAVSEPAWFGSQCCVKQTRVSSGVADSRLLLLAAGMACSHSANSLYLGFAAIRPGFPGALFHRLLFNASCCCQSFAVQVKAFLLAQLGY